MFSVEGDELWNTLDVSIAEFNTWVWDSCYDLYMEMWYGEFCKKDVEY